MDANVTASQSEHDHDNSSLQNPSTNPAEAGTTDETRDEDHETSSIEALNWSEVEEEELAAAQQQANLAASATRGNLPPTEEEAKVNNKADKDDESATNNGSSTTNDEGSVLSTTLLQSINSSVSDEDPQARKQSVIENWASEVTNAVERGEIVMTEDFPEENGTTGDDEEEDGDVDGNGGVRKRKGKKLSPEMISSMMSSASNGESSVDPLSNAPVLDDGPIWNKGPRSYTFQENRRINQKLTFCLLIAVVLAIGLGLGNLVAHQECEAEYKASQQSQTKQTDKISVHTVPTTTTPSPIIPDKSTDSSMMGSSLPRKQPVSDSTNEKMDDESLVNSESQNADKRQIPVKSFNEGRPRRRDEPVIDSKYKTHAETVSNVVNTLDRLSREIDQFENTTRKLQGVLVIPDEEKSAEESLDSTSLFDEEVHIDGDNEGDVINDDEDSLLDGEQNEKQANLGDEENQEAIIEDLIEAIEQTPDYLQRKMEEKKWEEYDKNRRHSKVWNGETEDTPHYPNDDHDIEMILKSVKQFKDFQRRFVKNERKRLRDEGKYDRLSWRLPEEYTSDEKNALKIRYRSNWQEFLKLIRAKVPDPIEAWFGTEEEDEDERTYGDLYYFPFTDPDRDLTEEEKIAQVKKNLAAAAEGMKIKHSEKEAPPETKAPSETETPSQTISEQLITNKESVKVVETTVEELDDDLIITESLEEHLESIESDSTSASSQHERATDEQDQIEVDNSIIGKSIEESSMVHAVDESPLKPQNSANTEASRLALEKIQREALQKASKLKIKKPASTATTHDATSNTNDKKSQWQAQTANVKNGKRDQKQKEQKVKQGKQKGKNGASLSGSSSSGANANDASSSGGKVKMSSKGKKLKNLESNKVFENIKGKSVDKRRGASPETQHQGKFGTDAKYKDLRKKRNEGNPEISKKSTSGSTNNYNKKKEERGHNGDTTSAANEKQKMKQTQQHHNNDNQKTKLNSNGRSNNNQPNGGSPKHHESKDAREQKRLKRESQNEKKGKSDFPSEKRSAKSSHASKDFSSKETQFRQQKVEFDAKPEVNRNSDLNSGAHQNGKRSKNWQSKEKAERREKSREKVSSWGT